MGERPTSGDSRENFKDRKPNKKGLKHRSVAADNLVEEAIKGHTPCWLRLAGFFCRSKKDVGQPPLFDSVQSSRQLFQQCAVAHLANRIHATKWIGHGLPNLWIRRPLSIHHQAILIISGR